MRTEGNAPLALDLLEAIAVDLYREGIGKTTMSVERRAGYQKEREEIRTWLIAAVSDNGQEEVQEEPDG